MLKELKKRLDQNLRSFIASIDERYGISLLSPLLFKSIKEFILREGKRIRPILFICGYLGFKKKIVAGLYQSALAIELLHDFMLVHDDIIDKSAMRRGKPSMHTMLNSYLARYRNIKFNGEDLSIAIGDVMYAMAIDAFLSIKEDPLRKEKALKKFIQAAVFTGAGEFMELINGTKSIKDICRQDIYKIYDYKTAYYTFACPLSTGAILAAAAPKQINNLFNYGIYLGRAFQIKDDILGMFGDEARIGKSTLTDLQEAKKTLLIWYAYRKSKEYDRFLISETFLKKKITRTDLLRIRRIIKESGALEHAMKEVASLKQRSQALIKSSTIRPPYKNILSCYAEELLKI